MFWSLSMKTKWLKLALVILLSSLPAACSIGKKQPLSLEPKKNAPFVLKQVADLKQISQLTGIDSINKTGQYDVYGADLGSMINAGDKTYLVFGDTFGYRSSSLKGGGGENWRSNVLAVTTDKDPSDGLTFDTMITDDSGKAIELLPSLKEDNNEMTTIPTNGVSVGDALYLYYMSVKHWGEPGTWITNHSGLAKSVDGGHKWSFINNAKWPGDSNFIQVSASKVIVDKHVTEIYLWGIPAGRFGGVKLMKVNEQYIEDISKYEYYMGTDKDGNPQWSSQMDDAAQIVNDSVGELSVIWNPYLERWIMMYLQGVGGVVIREGLTPWGPWGEAISVATQGDYPGLYAPFMNEKYMENNGESIYFTLSLWDPYNVFWMKVKLVK
jgi:hypothetical protein